jgi:acyl dehydratase
MDATSVRATYGEGPMISDWLEVTQELTDKFAEATLDPDWMHIDPERARREGPYDNTIAFGFWTLSMLTYFMRQSSGHHYPPGALHGFNYGLDRVRMLAPVHVGVRVRNHCEIVDVRDKGGGRFVVTTSNRVEIEGQDRPAMIADWLFMLVFPAF